jgi:serine/threonine-protein kinase
MNVKRNDPTTHFQMTHIEIEQRTPSKHVNLQIQGTPDQQMKTSHIPPASQQDDPIHTNTILAPTPTHQTLAYDSNSAVVIIDDQDSGHEETLMAPAEWLEQPQSKAPASKEALDTAGIRRSTVLPKAVLHGKTPQLKHNNADRYEQVKQLGEGAAGDVSLAKDNDIKRLVAVKKLKKQHHVPSSVARFVEEIQTVGKLEHPNIVPIHDVGIDENGQYYFVMKYVEGQTMEEIIQRLKDGDQEAHKEYTFAVRNQIFLKVLQAVHFAHQQGIIHRDLKPANIMIGQHGEVMVMDWGLAKQISGEELTPEQRHQFPPQPTQENLSSLENSTTRLFQTQHGSLLGTPAYMSPEQAAAANHLVDQRSDIYSLSALYYEWMGLTHYLAHKTTMTDLLWGILNEQPKTLAFVETKQQIHVPAEFSYFAMRGLEKSPDTRYQSIDEMLVTFQSAMAGTFDIKCPVTLVKRGGNDVLRMVDAHPLAFTAALYAAGAVFLYGTGSLLWNLGKLFLG